MGSKKRSAQAKRIAEFEAGFEDMGDIFEKEARRQDALDESREEALFNKACASKNRYATKYDALEAISLCEKHGTRGLRCYKCKYCNGWHLTSKKQ